MERFQGEVAWNLGLALSYFAPPKQPGKYPFCAVDCVVLNFSVGLVFQGFPFFGGVVGYVKCNFMAFGI